MRIPGCRGGIIGNGRKILKHGNEKSWTNFHEDLCDSVTLSRLKPFEGFKFQWLEKYNVAIGK
jgi:hypothetical protein